MKIFIDSANLEDIEAALARGFISGVTTNPSILAKEPKGNFEAHMEKIINLLTKYRRDGSLSLSVEVFSTDPKEIIAQAKRFVRQFRYPGLAIKVQIGWDELATIRALASEGIAINCTACMTPIQAVMAAASGAKFVSLFWGRIRDANPEGKTGELTDRIKELVDPKKEGAFKVLDSTDFDPAVAVARTRALLTQRGSKVEIIAGSMRTVLDIRDAALAGAHIVTVPPKFFKAMASHPKTDEVVGQFLADFKDWLS